MCEYMGEIPCKEFVFYTVKDELFWRELMPSRSVTAEMRVFE